MLRSTDFGGGENKRTPSLNILCCFFLSWLITWVFIFISTLLRLLEACSPTKVCFPSFTILLTPFNHFTLPLPPSPLLNTALYHFTQSCSESPSLCVRWPPSCSEPIVTPDYKWHPLSTYTLCAISSGEYRTKGRGRAHLSSRLLRQGKWKWMLEQTSTF